MSNLIQADKLIAEIERLKNQNERRLDNIVPIRRKDTIDEEQLAKIELRDKVDKAYLNGVLITLSDILSFITSLQQEQPEVDLEEELEQWRHKHFKGKRDGDYSGEYLERESQLDIARHFWNKGYNARKEE